MQYTQQLGRALTPAEVDFNFDQLSLKLGVPVTLRIDRGEDLTNRDVDRNFRVLAEATGEDLPIVYRQFSGGPLTGVQFDGNFAAIDGAINRRLYGDGPYPSMDLVFAGARFLDPRFTFSRPDPRWEIVNGVLRKYEPNEPVLLPDGWSVRPAETNLWWPTDASSRVSLVNITRTNEDTYPGPDEDGKPSLLFQAQTGSAAGGGNRYLGLGAYLATINRKTVSAIVRAKTASRFALRIQQPWPWRTDALFDLNTGALVNYYVSGFTDVVTKSTPLVDGWWRLDLTGTRVDSASFSANLGPTERLVSSGYETDDGTTPSAYVYAAWVNEGDPIPYIPTASAAKTQAADNNEISGATFQSLFNPAGGAMIVSLTLDKLAQTNSHLLQIWKDAGVRMGAVVRGADGKFAVFTTGSPDSGEKIINLFPGPGDRLNIGFAFDASGISYYLNGANIANSAIADHSTFLNSMTSFTLGRYITQDNQYKVGETVHFTRFFRERPTDTQMQSWTQ